MCSGSVLANIKRVYEKRSVTDGKRVLVDRLWPRGIKKGTQNVDLWMRDVAPSTELRKWFSHEPEKWPEFRERYRKELDESKALAALIDMAKRQTVTLVYAARDTEHNNAVVLAETIREKGA